MANNKGDGSIYQAKDKNGKPIPNCWRISVSFGSSGGDRQRVQCTVRGTKAKAKKKRGEWVNLANFERWWRSFRKEAGFDSLRFHELRHSQATLLLANGTDLKTVQDRMGHANGAITLNWYAHAIPENDQKAAQLVGNLFGTPPKRTQHGQSKIINLVENSPHAETFREKPDAVG